MTTEDLEIINHNPVHFQTNCKGIMDMYCDLETVAKYLEHHEGWFVRCASPMKVEPFGDNGYTLIIGRYGAFGYDVEPKMSVILDPPRDNFYHIYSVDNPDDNNLSYEVDYISTMNLEELDSLEAAPDIQKFYKKQALSEIPPVITRIHWQLNLQVNVQFPQFIYKLSMSVIKKTGDRLLAQIVKQISPRLSYKVQKDFHTRFNIPIPPQNSRTCKIVNDSK